MGDPVKNDLGVVQVPELPNYDFGKNLAPYAALSKYPEYPVGPPMYYNPYMMPMNNQDQLFQLVLKNQEILSKFIESSQAKNPGFSLVGRVKSISNFVVDISTMGAMGWVGFQSMPLLASGLGVLKEYGPSVTETFFGSLQSNVSSVHYWASWVPFSALFTLAVPIGMVYKAIKG